MQPCCTTYLNVKGGELYEHLRFFEVRRCDACQGKNIGSIYLYIFGKESSAAFVVRSFLGVDPKSINKIIIQSYRDGSTDLHLYLKF